MKIAVIGTGYVGLVAGTCFADMENDVVCVDLDAGKINKLKKGISPIYEPGLEELIKKNLSAGRLSFTTEIGDAVKKSSVVFIAVGTPQTDEGKADLSYVKQAAEQIGKAMNDEKVIVNRSTVPVGTADMVRDIISKQYKGKFFVVSSPEFLREGSAVKDFMSPDRIVVGCDDAKAKEIMEELYKPLDTEVFFTDIKSSEIIKYASNTFLAIKISFINEIAMLSDKVGANVKDVAKGVGMDKRINPFFLNAGCGWGGSCLPKDVNAMIYNAGENNVELNVLSAAKKTNEEVKHLPVQKLKDKLGSLKGKRIALLGLAFKANTDDMREASSIVIAEQLKTEGAKISAYDPVAMENAKKIMPYLEYCKTACDAISGADAIIIATDWPQFKSIDYKKVKETLKRPLVIDGRNILDRSEMKKNGYEYFGMGVQ